jgi:hypothetical protein
MAMTEPTRMRSPINVVASFGLPGSERGPVAVPPPEWPAFLSVLDAQRLTGLAVATAEAGVLQLSPEQIRELSERHRLAMLWALIVERKLLTLQERFEASGIEVVVLKGATVARTVYPDPTWRPFGDLDLLVRTADWRRACDLLAGLGFRRELPEPRPGFDERFGKAALHRNGDSVEVDLHRTLVLGPFGLWIPPEELFRHTTSLVLGGREVRRLDDEALLLHACIHASLGWHPPLLMPLRDVAQVARSGHVDWGAVADLARRWRLQAVLRHAFETSATTLGVAMPPEALRVIRTEASHTERRVLRAYTSGRRSRGGTAISTLRAIPGVRAKAAYLRALLLPGREFMDVRSGPGTLSYFRRWMTPVRWFVAGRRTEGSRRG